MMPSKRDMRVLRSFRLCVWQRADTTKATDRLVARGLLEQRASETLDTWHGEPQRVVWSEFRMTHLGYSVAEANIDPADSVLTLPGYRGTIRS